MTFTGILPRFREYALGQRNVTFGATHKEFIFNYPCTSEAKCAPYEVLFSPGTYKIELWGAQGGDARYQNTDTLIPESGGKGAYVSGIIHMVGTTKMFLYIGGKGADQTETGYNRTSPGGFNGGGNGGVDLSDTDHGENGAGGGGSTDLRMYKDDSLKALKSRIIVAGAGGGGCSTNHTETVNSTAYGGSGGSLTGTTLSRYSLPGNQTQGVFGRGTEGVSCDHPQCNYGGSSGGNGSGYYGGLFPPEKMSGYMGTLETAGAGGSSYISGHEECNSVVDDESDPPTHTDSSIHYTNWYFNNTVMKQQGDSGFVDPYGTEENGHYGNGAAKITIIEARESLPIFPTCSYKLRKTLKGVVLLSAMTSKN